MGEWVRHQRKEKLDGELSDERIKKLDDIGFKWAVKVNADLDLGRNHLKKILFYENKSRRELAQILDIGHHNTINRWCNNKANIPERYISKIAEIFNIEPHLIQPQKGDGCIK